MPGFDPGPTAWKAVVLPLHHMSYQMLQNTPGAYILAFATTDRGNGFSGKEEGGWWEELLRTLPAAWKAVVLPLHHVCAGFNGCKHTSLSLGKLVTHSPTVGFFLSSGWRRGRAETRHGDQWR